MTQEEIVAMVLRDTLAKLPPEEREKAEAAIAELRGAIEKHGDYGKFAVGFIGAQLAAE